GSAAAGAETNCGASTSPILIARLLSAHTAPSPASPRAAPEQHDLDGLQEDQRIEAQIAILDVEQIERQLLGGILDARAVRIAQLRPTGQPWFYTMPQCVIGDILAEFGDELRAFGTRSDEAHRAAQHIPQLRQFIEPQFADHAPDAGDALVVF